MEKPIEYSLGSARNPLTNTPLKAKFAGIADVAIPPEQRRRLMEMCWNVASSPDAAQLARAAVV